ncbi:hypothetical protein WJX79_007064 [Trebouxia sp. C0005]
MVVSPRADVGHRDAHRTAENLFETQSVVQIREVETKARNDIEDKKQQLRQLVGGSYRDLIDSADTILSMTTCCEAAVAQVVGIQTDFAKLTNSVSKVPHSKSRRNESGTRKEQLFAVGSRVKYLVDTSELLWGCLDTQDYFDAAHRYLRASEVHRLLVGTAPASMARFPLLRHQWPSIEALKGQILEGTQQRLKAQTHLSAQDAAAAVAAASFLDQLTSSQALELFLGCCRHRAVQPLAAAAKGGLTAADLQDLLTKLAAIVQEVVTQVGQLFLPPLASAAAPLLVQQACEDLSSGELMFSPLPGQERSQEAEAWQEVRKATMKRLAPMPQATASSACQSWLEHLAKDIVKHCPAPMAACITAPDFALLEGHLQAAINHWQPPPAPPAAEPMTLAATPRLSPLTPLRQSPFEPAEGQGSGVPDTWEGVCDWVLGKRLDLWQTLFEQPFFQRAQDLITASFQDISNGFTIPLQDCLKAAQQAPPAAPGGYYAPQWPEHTEVGVLAGQLGAVSRTAGANSRSYRLRKRSRHSRGDTEGSSRLLDGWRGLLEGVCLQVNDQLKEALRGSQLLLGKQDQGKASAAKDDYMSNSPSFRHENTNQRASQLQPFIQQQCSAAVQSMGQELDAQLKQLGQPGMDLDGAKLVEQALLLGRLSHSVGSKNTALSLIMGPPEIWQAPEGPTLAPQRAGQRQSAVGSRAAAKSPGAALHEALQEQLRNVTLKAYKVWADWVARGLCMELQAALESDAALTSPVPLQAWEETVIAQEDSMDEGGGEMRFSLPAAPSPGPLLFLLAACRELARAGGHTTGAVAVQLLQWELGNAVLQALSEVLQSSSSLSSSLSEKGLLQLLFDVRFLSDALAGGKPLKDTPGRTQPSRAQRGHDKAQSPAVQERQRAFQSLEGSLSNQLDPIDWATYEPYLWANEATYYQRAATLFGALLQTRRLHSQVTPKPATSFDANILSVAPTAPRFSYLPISTPSLTSSALRNHPASTASPMAAGMGLVPTGPAALARPSDMLDQTGDYSFANINVGRAMSAVSAEQQRAVESASGTTLETLQSKFSAGTTGTSQRLGAFGSLLGDKAAEVVHKQQDAALR